MNAGAAAAMVANGVVREDAEGIRCAAGEGSVSHLCFGFGVHVEAPWLTLLRYSTQQLPHTKALASWVLLFQDMPVSAVLATVGPPWFALSICDGLWAASGCMRSFPSAERLRWSRAQSVSGSFAAGLGHPEGGDGAAAHYLLAGIPAPTVGVRLSSVCWLCSMSVRRVCVSHVVCVDPL